MNDLLIFASIVLLASISPGPNVFIVIINSMRVGWKKAIWTMLGNVCALFLMALLAAIGVGTILAQSQSVFSLLKILGGLYLIYMGYKIFKGRHGVLEVQRAEQAPRSTKKLFLDGFTVSLSNPKAVIFLASIFPQFLQYGEAILPQFIAMFLVIISAVVLVHGAYAVFAEYAARTMKSSRVHFGIKTITAAAFSVFGSVLMGEGLVTFRR